MIATSAPPLFLTASIFWTNSSSNAGLLNASTAAFLIPIALGMGALGLAAFRWSMKAGQYEDMDGAANRILIDEEDEA